MKCQNGSIHAHHSEIFSYLLELELKRGHFITVLLKFGLDLAVAAVLSYDKAEEPTFTSSNLGSREEHRRSNIVRSALLISELAPLLG